MGAGISTTNENPYPSDTQLTHSVSAQQFHDEMFYMEPEDESSLGEVTPSTSSSLTPTTTPTTNELRPRDEFHIPLKTISHFGKLKLPALKKVHSPESVTSNDFLTEESCDDNDDYSPSFEIKSPVLRKKELSPKIQSSKLLQPSPVSPTQLQSPAQPSPVRKRSHSLFHSRGFSKSPTKMTSDQGKSKSLRNSSSIGSPTKASPFNFRGSSPIGINKSLGDESNIYSPSSSFNVKNNPISSSPSSQAPYNQSFHDDQFTVARKRKHNLDVDQIIMKKGRSNSICVTPAGLSQSLPHRLSPIHHEVKTTYHVSKGVDMQGRKTVNQYSFISQIGSGVSSKVKLCFNWETGEECAIKVINRSLMKSVNHGIRRFSHKGISYESILREIAILKKVKHPNIVRVIEVIDDPTADKMYIVLEHVKGGELLKMDSEGNAIGRGKKVDVSFSSEASDSIDDSSPLTDDDGLQSLQIRTPLNRITRTSYSPLKNDAISRTRSQSAAPMYSPVGDSSQNGDVSTSSESSPVNVYDENYLQREDGTIPEPLARIYFRSLISALNYLHKNNIVHRDIKPENILIEASTNTLKLSDFGVSQFTDGEDDSFEDTTGTPAFYPPESCSKGRTFGRAADVWACGITLYVMLFGRLPFRPKPDHQGAPLFSLFKSIESDELEIPEGISDELRSLFERLLDKNPNTRITTDELLHHPWLNLDKEENQEEDEQLDTVNDDEISTAITIRHHFKILDKVFYKIKDNWRKLKTPRSPLTWKQSNILKPLTTSPPTQRFSSNSSNSPQSENTIPMKSASVGVPQTNFVGRNRAFSMVQPSTLPPFNTGA